MKKVLLGIAIILVALAVMVLLVIPKGPNLKQYAYLQQPAISQKPDQKMLVVSVVNDPSTQSGEAIRLLYKTYFRLKGVPKRMSEMAPRARWVSAADAPKQNWVGFFALPVPDTLTTLPVLKEEERSRVFLQTWEYGTVAQILHVGSYATEEKTVRALKDYITLKGYKIDGEHEETYLKGPGMLGIGNPEKYMTIISYRVKLVNPKQ
jgi:hypothetical protein